MNRAKGVLVVLVLFAAAASGWAQAVQTVVVPISGEYYDGAAGGILVYGGTVTLTWSTSSPEGWPMKGTVVATAYSKNTGASYTLYGYCTDCLTGAAGTTMDLDEQVLAIESGSVPAFQTRIRLSLAMPNAALPPAVQTIAFVGR